MVRALLSKVRAGIISVSLRLPQAVEQCGVVTESKVILEGFQFFAQ
jgi:hypothetical protein